MVGPLVEELFCGFPYKSIKSYDTESTVYFVILHILFQSMIMSFFGFRVEQRLIRQHNKVKEECTFLADCFML